MNKIIDTDVALLDFLHGFQKYGKHTDQCEIHNKPKMWECSDYKPVCNCGFDELMKQCNFLLDIS